MARVPRSYLQAAERWGHLADAQAHKYGLPNGATLLLKIAYVESRFNMNAVSSAGARGGTQFMPETRAAYVKRYGVDPWKSPDEAMHATALFMKTTGLAGYNPGSSTYIHEVLRAPVAARQEQVRVPRGAQSPSPLGEGSSSGFGGDLMHLGLVGVLVLGGVGLMGLGLSRFAGSSPAGKAVRG